MVGGQEGFLGTSRHSGPEPKGPVKRAVNGENVDPIIFLLPLSGGGGDQVLASFSKGLPLAK